MKSLLFALLSFIFVLHLSCNTGKPDRIMLDEFRYEFAWDVNGVVQEIESVEESDVSEMKRLAISMRQIENDEARLVGRYFEAKAAYYAFEDYQWMDAFDKVYDELKERGLFGYLYFIDNEIHDYYRILGDTKLAEDRLANIKQYIFFSENKTLKRRFVSMLSSRVSLTEKESDLSGLLRERISILESLVTEEWNSYNFSEYIRLAKVYEAYPDSQYQVSRIYDHVFEKASEENHLYTKAKIHFQIATARSNDGLFDESAHHLKMAISIVESSGHNRFLYLYSYFLGHVYMQMKLPSLAKEQYKKSYELSSRVHREISLECIAYLAWATFKDGSSEESYTEATVYFDQVLQEQNQGKICYFLALQRKKWALLVLKRKEEALALNGRLLSWNRVGTKQSIRYSEVLRNSALSVISKGEEDNDTLIYEIDEQRKRLISQRIIIGLSSLLFFFAGATSYYYRKRNILLQESISKGLVIEEQNKKLEIANEYLVNSKAELETELKNQLLMSNNIRSMLNSLERNLKEIVKDEGAKKHLLRIFKRNVGNKIFEEIDHKFLKANESFFVKLTSIHPNLTINELKLSALLKMNLSTKEIASMQYKEIGSVKMARSRLIRKLKHNDEHFTNLVPYLISISAEGRAALV